MTPHGSINVTPPISNTYRLAGGSSLTRLKKFSTPPVPCLKVLGTDSVTIGWDMCQDREYMGGRKI